MMYCNEHKSYNCLHEVRPPLNAGFATPGLLNTRPLPKDFAEVLRTNNVLTALMAVRDEVTRAQKLWPRPFSCAHEGISVIREEFEELWDEVKLNEKKRDLEKIRKEAVQVAAMAIRFIVEVIDEGRGRE